MLGAQAPRQAGRVGAYTPPIVWPQRARTFDLLHQRIAISYDLDKRSMAGEVETRLVVKAQPTDTIRLDASQLTIDGATDASKQNLKFAFDTSGVTVHLAKRARVVYFAGLPKHDPVSPLDMNQLHYKELAILGAYGATHRQYRITMDYLDRKQEELARVVTHRFPLEEIGQAFETIRAGTGLKMVILP